MPTKHHYYIEDRGSVYRVSKTQLTRLLSNLKNSHPVDLESYGPRITRKLMTFDSLQDDPAAKMSELWSDHP